MREKSEAAARTRARRRSRGGLNDFTFCGLCFSDACTHTHTRACALHTKTLFHIILPLPPQHAHSFEAFAACRGYFSARIKPAPPLWRAPFSVSLAPARAPAFHGRGGGGGIPPPPPPPLLWAAAAAGGQPSYNDLFFAHLPCSSLSHARPPFALFLPCLFQHTCVRAHTPAVRAGSCSLPHTLSLSLSLSAHCKRNAHAHGGVGCTSSARQERSAIITNV